jgi:hypothetical protein
MPSPLLCAVCYGMVMIWYRCYNKNFRPKGYGFGAPEAGLSSENKGWRTPPPTPCVPLSFQTFCN